MNTVRHLPRAGNATKIILVVAFIALLIIAYGIWTEGRTGDIEVTAAKRGSVVYLDKQAKGIAGVDGQTITLKRVRAGEHSVIVSIEGYYPWEKTVRVRANKIEHISAWNVPTEIFPSYRKTEFASSDRAEIESLIADSERKTRVVAFSGEGNVEIKKEKNRIVATWLGTAALRPDFFCGDTTCANTVAVFDAETEPIGAFEFFPARDDVILLSLPNGIIAIEIDRRDRQNFQPLYAARGARFAVDHDTSMIYIQDGEAIFGFTT